LSPVAGTVVAKPRLLNNEPSGRVSICNAHCRANFLYVGGSAVDTAAL
jgi:hypothetical protein